MVPVRDLFEKPSDGHKPATLIILFLAEALWDWNFAVFAKGGLRFCWIGRARTGFHARADGKSRTGPHRRSLHVAFNAHLVRPAGCSRRAFAGVRSSRSTLRAGEPTDEPVVFVWMPAASRFFHDPDGNLFESLSMPPDAPRPDSRGHRMESLESQPPIRSDSADE